MEFPLARLTGRNLCAVVTIAAAMLPLPALGQTTTRPGPYITATMPTTAAGTEPTITPEPSSPDDMIEPTDVGFKQRMIDALPHTIDDGLEIDAWGWFADSQNNRGRSSNYHDVEVSLGITKSINQIISLSAQGNFIDADGQTRGELEQAYGSVVIAREAGVYVTVGKFNANFGVEGRDFWERTTGSTSVLFGAQPQDLVGIMGTIPLGKTHVALKPFISADFQGQWDFDQSPSVGMLVEWKPVRSVDIGITNWVGPGLSTRGGRPVHNPFNNGAYGSNADQIFGNWQGPNLTSGAGGTLYFFEGRAAWHPTDDFTVSGEFLQGRSSNYRGEWGWFGAMVQLDYDLTDKWRLFVRFSYLDDTDWIITGSFQKTYEYSGGVSYQLLEGVEIRGELRHDRSDVFGDVNTASIHLTFTY